MLRELLWWVVSCKHFSGLLGNIEGILVGSRQTLLPTWGPSCLHTWGKGVSEGNSAVFIQCPRATQDSARLRKPWGLGRNEVMFLLSWSNCWFSVGTKQNVKFSTRFGSYSSLYWLGCSGDLPRNLLMWAHVCIFVHLDRHICLPADVCLCVQGVSASVEIATSKTESKVQRWLWRSESKMVITFTANLVKPTFGPIELVWGFFFFLFSFF